jgi:hypothetical protein
MTALAERHHRSLGTKHLRRLVWAVLLSGLSACGGVELGDTLTQDLPPAEAAACRQAVADELTRQGVSAERIRRIYYERLTNRLRGATRRNTGYRAWVYPRQGREAMIIELSGSCQVRDVWMHGPEGGDSGGTGGTM